MVLRPCVCVAALCSVKRLTKQLIVCERHYDPATMGPPASAEDAIIYVDPTTPAPTTRSGKDDSS